MIKRNKRTHIIVGLGIALAIIVAFAPGFVGATSSIPIDTEACDTGAGGSLPPEVPR